MQAEQVSEVQTAVHEILQVRDNLLGAIRLWEKEHILRAPVDGIVSVTQNRIQGQLVGGDEAVMSILPFANVQAPVCIAHVGAAGLGRVNIGDKAKIYLQAFPDQEFGHLLGKVQAIAQLPDQSGGPSTFRIDIVLENGLVSTYRKEIPFRQEMAASVAIITSKRSLMARIFDRLGKVFK
jgi:HlyD family secretion protein